ncbi:hypothetical protein HII31_05372 [Pseudocercospora fuligena]|uniref:Uncharacterized protein n=1 Tax=Pseudocercospora fuligena TaxID=685502 RepID=A0A8H6RLG8_9PEZI|nr:hypothetical protein HII31_05372 [Pseudocercospora fuligena]
MLHTKGFPLCPSGVGAAPVPSPVDMITCMRDDLVLCSQCLVKAAEACRCAWLFDVLPGGRWGSKTGEVERDTGSLDVMTTAQSPAGGFRSLVTVR